MRALLAIALVLLIALIGSFGLAYSGIYNVAATDRHWSLTQQMLETVRIRSIKAHTAGIRAPADLADPDKLIVGVEHFAAHCAVCHGGPGVPKGDIGKGLYRSRRISPGPAPGSPTLKCSGLSKTASR